MDTGYDIEWNGFLFLNQIKSDLSGLDNVDVNTNLAEYSNHIQECTRIMYEVLPKKIRAFITNSHIFS